MRANLLAPDAAQLLRDLDQANVYVTDDDTARALFHAGPSAGFNVYRIDLSQARTEQELLRILGKALHFPDWYGGNWDALADSLADMSWNEADGYLIIFQRSEVLRKNFPDAHATFVKLLQETVKSWQTQNVAFWVLFVGDHPDLPHVGVKT